MTKQLGRHFTIDAPARAFRTKDWARKTLVSTFPGEHYHAEREGAELRIYSVTDENGQPATMDGADVGVSTQTMERRNRTFYDRSRR
jgi:hypothetical protein